VDDKIPTDLAFYRPQVGRVLDVFGIDRVLYGATGPRRPVAPVPVGFKIVPGVLHGQGQAAAESTSGELDQSL